MANDKYKKIFSKNLNYYMDLRHKIQDDFIRDLDINKSTISSWCNGTRIPKMDKVQEVADYLHINISDLLSENSISSNYFEFVSEDDAMYPLLDTGDIALIYKEETFTKTATYLIELNNRKTIRKIRLTEDKKNYELLAMNASYKTINIPVDELKRIKILGRVIKAENESAFN